MSTVLVIGGGAAGMVAAYRAAGEGQHHVILLERQARVGRKLLSTGNGRCNLTNMNLSFSHYHGDQPDFVQPVLTRFGPRQTLDFFAGLGLLTVAEPDGRVYPLSNQANSVLDVLRFALEAAGVELRTGQPVRSLTRAGNQFLVTTDTEELSGDFVIVACGGAAGGKLGGVMDGYALLKSMGHRRTGLFPSLTQLKTDTNWPRALKGVKADCAIRLFSGRHTLAEVSGELLFTETGVSGPGIFDLSRWATTGGEGLTLSLDFFRDYPQDALVELLEQRQQRFPQLETAALFTGMLHNRLGQCLVQAAGLPRTEPLSRLTPQQLREACQIAKAFSLHITGSGGLENAQVTAGGVCTDGFDPQTLESRICPGLFACGEVLDVDGDCGGYNLQWAWASGYCAGGLGK
jgi:predicted Rossmann fold flavoprotein